MEYFGFGVAGLHSVASFLLCLILAIVKKRGRGSWIAAVINPTPLATYLLIWLLASKIIF
jgi:hypothetical protein